MSLLTRIKTLRSRHPALTYSGISILLIIILLVTVRVSITPLAKSGIIDWLNDHNVTATVEDIQLDISGGRLSLRGFDAHDDEGHGAHIGLLEVNWRWQPLSDNHLIVHRVYLDDFHIDALLYADGKMNIAGLQLPLASEEVTQDSEQAPDKNSSFAISLTGIELSNINACIKQFVDSTTAPIDYCTSLGRLLWTGSIDYTLNPEITKTETKSVDLPLAINGTLSLDAIKAQNNSLQRQLISVDAIKFTEIQLSGLNTIKLRQFSIDKLSALERSQHEETNNAHILTFNKLNIDDIQLTNTNSMTIGTIAITDTSAYLHIQKDGTTEFAQWQPATQSPDEPVKDKPTEPSTAFQYSVDKFTYISSRPITYVDNSLKETFTFELPKIDIEIGPIDSKQPEAITHIKLDVTTGKHATIKLNTDINLLSAKPDLKGTAHIASLELRAFSPLTKQYIGHSVRSGQLDSDITLKADKGILDSNLSLTLNQFELRALNKKEAEELNSDIGFPLNSSLSLLRDRDNRIHLDIPITGDINNPDFNPADAIKTATSKAVTTAILYYYTPFGLVLAADALFDIATALHFDPLLFTAGQSQLEPAHTKQLDILAAMLIERPGIHLTLCGTSSNIDTTLLYPDTVKAAEKTESKQLVLDKAQTKTLLDLAEHRGNAVKDYLVNNKKIEASRLIVCEPEYQEDMESPLVEMSI